MKKSLPLLILLAVGLAAIGCHPASEDEPTTNPPASTDAKTATPDTSKTSS